MWVDEFSKTRVEGILAGDLICGGVEQQRIIFNHEHGEKDHVPCIA